VGDINLIVNVSHVVLDPVAKHVRNVEGEVILRFKSQTICSLQCDQVELLIHRNDDTLSHAGIISQTRIFPDQHGNLSSKRIHCLLQWVIPSSLSLRNDHPSLLTFISHQGTFMSYTQTADWNVNM
jgi:hypothetical protein